MKGSRRKSQRGVALLMSVFLMVAVTTIAMGIFLNLARHQTVTARGVDRIEMNWVAEGTIDRATRLFSDFVKNNGQYPDYSSSTYEVFNVVDGLGEPGGDSFGKLLADWWKSSPSPWGAGFPVEIASKTSGEPDISITMTETPDWKPGEPLTGITGTDAWREYMISFRLKNTRTLGEQRVQQTIRVTPGRLFDFMTFSNQDLEIAPGPDSTIQGPIFANGNIYLMNNMGSTLSLKSPGFSSTVTEAPIVPDYTVKTAKNVFFYFKKVLAANYLDVPGSPYEAQLDRIEAISQTLGYPMSLRNPKANGNVPTTELYHGIYLHPDKTLPDPGTEWIFPPLFYTFENGAELGWANWTNPADKNDNIIELTNASGGSLQYLTPPRAPIWLWSTNYSGWDRTAYYINDYPLFEGWQGVMNVSTAFRVKAPPYVEEGWDPASPTEHVATGDLSVTEPYTRPGLDLTVATGGVVQEHAPPGALALGAEHPHDVIEPAMVPAPTTDPEKLKIEQLKFDTKADIRIDCTSGTCSVQKKNGDAIDLSLPPPVSFYDYRLQGYAKAVVLDLEALRLFVTPLKETLDPGHDGIVIYVKVNSVSSLKGRTVSSGTTLISPDTVRLVIVTNGEKGLGLKWEDKVKGFTLATNGRLWVQGDLNTYKYDTTGAPATECSYDDITAGTCRVPSSALFSDSFGVFYGSSYQSWGPGTSLLDPIRTVPAGTEVNLFAGVVTGLLESQLEEKYKCFGTDTDDGVNYSNGCLCKEREGKVGLDFNSNDCETFFWDGRWMTWAEMWDSWPGDNFKTDADGVPFVNKNGTKFRDLVTRNPEYASLPQWVKDEEIPVLGIARDFRQWGWWGAGVMDVSPVPVRSMPGIRRALLVGRLLTGTAILADVCTEYSSDVQPIPMPGGEKGIVMIYPQSGCTRTRNILVTCPEQTDQPGKNNAWDLCDLPVGPLEPVPDNYPLTYGPPSPASTDPYYVDTHGHLQWGGGDDPITVHEPLYYKEHGSGRIVKETIMSLFRSYHYADGNNIHGGNEWRGLIYHPVRNPGGWLDPCYGTTSGGECDMTPVGISTFQVRVRLKPGEHPVTLDESIRVDASGNFQVLVTKGGSLSYQTVFKKGDLIYRYRADGYEYPMRFVAKREAGLVNGVMTYAYFWVNHNATEDGNNAVYDGENTDIFDPSINDPDQGISPIGCLEPLTRANVKISPFYYHTQQFALYNRYYSGGLENLINFQEEWSTNNAKLNFSGVLSTPWNSEELLCEKPDKWWLLKEWAGINPPKTKTVAPAYFLHTYYTPPKRNYDYYEWFLSDPPPAAPGIYSIVRTKYRQKNLNET